MSQAGLGVSTVLVSCAPCSLPISSHAWMGLWARAGRHRPLWPGRAAGEHALTRLTPSGGEVGTPGPDAPQEEQRPLRLAGHSESGGESVRRTGQQAGAGGDAGP